MFLVIGATDDETLNRGIHADAERLNLLCNIADRPEICNFVLPAIFRRGDFMMAISTAGKSPAFAKHIRQRLETQFGPEYGTLLDLLGAIRTRLLAAAHEPEIHKPRDKKITQIDRVLEQVLGAGYRYDQLMASDRQTGE
jgi:precorrin-2 dehydrogenase/sirohydrochlorin ferrochelatase